MTTEVEWRRRWKPDIGAKPWQQFEVDGEMFLVKFYHDVDHCDFFICDFTHMWHEKLVGKAIHQRNKKLNPNVEAPLSKLMQHVEDHMTSQKKATDYSVVRMQDTEESRVFFKLHTKLAGLPFSWQFEAVPVDRQMFARHLNIPLLGMVGELLRRQNELVQLLHNKDKEIDDYKAQGVRVSRRHLETPAFDETVFNSTMSTSKGFAEGVHHLGQKAFSESGQTLYTEILSKHAWLTRGAREVLDGESLLDEASAEVSGAGETSWGNRIPASLLPSEAPASSASPSKSPAVSPLKSPVKSPAKTSSAESTPVKDSELLRRQALERRLQEEEEKKEVKTKKKKKIKF